MRTRGIILFISLIIMSTQYAQEKKDYKLLSIAFYNVENLFDTEDDPLTFDDDRTPQGKDHWTEEIYQDKLKNLAQAIAAIGKSEAGISPVVIGLCEVENMKVLEDLIQQPPLAEQAYGIVHYESPDRRGIDVALLYQTKYFIPRSSASHELLLYDSQDPIRRVYTRDQLVVSGLLEGEEMHFIVNHWPSRSGGVSRSSYKREKAAALTKKIVDSLHSIDPYSKIVVMGDFNDDPSNRSFRKILKAEADKEKVSFQGIYNPMASLLRKGIGSLAYRDSWNLFDQLLVSASLLEKDHSSYRFLKAGVFNENFLITPSGQYKGYPFRSFGYGGYTGGYSDHFPVYIYLIREIP